METASFIDKRGLLPSWKASRHLNLLDIIQKILLAGYTSGEVGDPDEDRQHMPFSSLDQAAAAHPIVDEVREAVGVSSYNALWRLLLQAHPGFKKTKLHMIGERKPKQAQDAAKELCGQAPMTFKHVQDDPTNDTTYHPLLEPVLSPGFCYMYTFLQMIWNLFLDAGKSEPQKWVLNRTGITHVGAKYDRIAHPLLKMTVWSYSLSESMHKD